VRTQWRRVYELDAAGAQYAEVTQSLTSFIDFPGGLDPGGTQGAFYASGVPELVSAIGQEPALDGRLHLDDKVTAANPRRRR